MLSNTCKYGIRAVIYLAVNGKKNQKIGIKTISKDLELPTPFLGKILQLLAKNKILSSTKGPHGGFGLARQPGKITLYNIIEIIDGLDVFNECLIGLRICENDKKLEAKCPFSKKSHLVREQLKKLFKEQTIGELAKSIKNSDVVLKF